MPEHGHVRVGDGFEQALGHFLLGQVERVVDTGHHVIEFREKVIVKVEAAIAQDVHLAASEDFEAHTVRRELRIQLANLSDLLAKAVGMQAVGLKGAFAVIGDAQVLKAEVDGGFGHLAQGSATVAGGGVVVEDAAQVLQLDQIGQRAVGGGFELAVVLPQHGLDVVQPKRAVEAGLVFDGGRWGDVFAFHHAQAVLIQGPAAFQGALAHGDVVLLAAGEVVQGKREVGTRHRAQVALQAIGKMHAGLGVAVRDDMSDQRMADEGSDDLQRLAGRDEEVEVVHDLLATAETAADLHLSRGGMLLQKRPQLHGRPMHLIESKLRGMGFAEGDAFQDLLDAFGSKTRELRGRAGFADTFQIGDTSDTEFGVQGFDFFGTEALQFEQLKETFRELGLEGFVELQATRDRHLVEFFQQRIAEAFDAFELVVGRQCHDVARIRLDNLCAGLVSTDFEGVLALEIKQQGNAVEDVGSGFAGHGGDSAQGWKKRNASLIPFARS